MHQFEPPPRLTTVSRVGASLLIVAALATSGCSPNLVPSTNSAQPCDDSIGVATSASQAPLPSESGRVYIGTGDTFFIGTVGRHWGENVEYYGGAFHMKVGIYILDSQPPTVTVLRSDGAGGRADFAATSAGLPGPLPTSLTFATAGCWQIEARGRTGFATIRVSVQSP